MTTPVVSITSSLEDIRRRYYETQREFARRIGVTPQTYRRILARDPAVEPPTMRHIAERLDVPPHLIAEFVPAPSPERLAALDALITAANESRAWMTLNDDGTLTPDPDAVCLPGAP